MNKYRVLALLIAFTLGSGLCQAADKIKSDSRKKETAEASTAGVDSDATAKKKEEKKAAKPDTTGDVIPNGYPLKTCVVCNTPLKFGTLYTFTYHRDNKPDCTVVLCHKNCVKDFEKNPDKYIDMVFAAKK